MKRINISMKGLLALGLIFTSSALFCAPRFFIKNDTYLPITIKFADPENERAVKEYIAGGGEKYFGPADMNDLPTRLSVAGQVIGFRPLNVTKLRQETMQKLKATISGYERDVYWVIFSSGGGWDAHVATVEHKAN